MRFNLQDEIKLQDANGMAKEGFTLFLHAFVIGLGVKPKDVDAWFTRRAEEVGLPLGTPVADMDDLMSRLKLQMQAMIDFIDEHHQAAK